MNNKAQAGLEYLMTYGWALVIIVAIASALFFVIGTPTNQFTCNSSDPTKIILKAVNPPKILDTPACMQPAVGGDKYIYWFDSAAQPSEILLQNATGGNITITAVKCLSQQAWPNNGWKDCYRGNGTCFGYLCDTAGARGDVSCLAPNTMNMKLKGVFVTATGTGSFCVSNVCL